MSTFYNIQRPCLLVMDYEVIKKKRKRNIEGVLSERYNGCFDLLTSGKCLLAVASVKMSGVLFCAHSKRKRFLLGFGGSWLILAAIPLLEIHREFGSSISCHTVPHVEAPSGCLIQFSLLF